MTATTLAAIARKRARDNERRKALYRDDPAYREKRSEQNRQCEQKRGPRGPRDRSQRREAERIAQDNKLFVGADGEGVGRGAEHRYTMFRIGDRQLGPFNDKRLTSYQLLNFICNYPYRNHIIVGFAFGYDASMILRDISWQGAKNYPSQIERLFEADDDGDQLPGGAKTRGKRGRYWTWLVFPGYGSFGVKYVQGKFLHVCRAVFDAHTCRFRSIPGSARIIYDTFGFFQCSFVSALKAWNIGARYIDAVKAMKDQRETFETTSQAIIDYNRRECELLAEMMTAFRKACLDAGIRPRRWNGAGQLASAMHEKHKTLTKAQLEDIAPKGLLDDACKAYYGGRAEVGAIGQLSNVHQYDLNSAYPSAMLELPCLEHGKWKKTSGADLQDKLDDKSALFVCAVTFSHPHDGNALNKRPIEGGFNGLPFRAKDGSLSWPSLGKGTYWSPELRSARLLDAEITCHEGWLYEKRCDCKPFAWIETYYQERKKIARENKSRGIPIKLGLNALSGKLAQRVGKPKWRNPIWAGLVTSIIRARMNEAAAKAGPRNVVMIATDGIFITKPIRGLDLGSELGQWSHEGGGLAATFPSLFIVKPGMYWSDKIKSRGISVGYIEKHLAEFETAFANFMERETPWKMPSVKIKITTFVGLRLAWRRGAKNAACTWEEHDAKISFEYSKKRAAHRATHDKQGLILSRPHGSHAHVSHFYTMDGLATEERRGGLEAPELLFEALPDPPD